MNLHDINKSILTSLASTTDGFNDPYQRVNIHPRVWGPPGWTFIYSIIDALPSSLDYEQQRKIFQFIISLGLLLPCQRCRDNFNGFIKRYPPDNYIHSRGSIKQWFNKYRSLMLNKNM